MSKLIFGPVQIDLEPLNNHLEIKMIDDWRGRLGEHLRLHGEEEIRGLHYLLERVIVEINENKQRRNLDRVEYANRRRDK